MAHQLTITVDDTVYQALKPLVGQETIESLLYRFIQETLLRVQNLPNKQNIPFITSLRGTLHKVDTSDIRDEADRPL